MRGGRLLGLGVTGFALVVGTAMPAQAQSDPNGAPRAALDYDVDVYKYTDDNDPGGSSGSICLHRPGSVDDTYYCGQFWARGDRFSLYDFHSDGRKAEAVVIAYNHKGEVADVDRFRTGTTGNYNLGTPDGSGNVPEGYKITVRIRIEGSDWARGTLHVRA